ncbi:hypothetical protein GCM10010911_10470 [Paenibacillus nasutitermitis]|uniref:Bypass of forespore C C-terminal domain-containing protein n=2 Tax=Paenibacillus nasutitermitis TaxID=1652958 RepID=A0A917DN33_9BACL|nr:hypothetical protein GCM10010911_10470 [Paenibacillus nasutitermitis]
MLVLLGLSPAFDVPAASAAAHDQNVSGAHTAVHGISPQTGVDSQSGADSGSVIKLLAEYKGPVKVMLHRTYVCGEETSSLGTVDTREVLQMLKHHPEWTAVRGGDHEVIMEQRMDDLSEACKRRAYIGMDKDGNLSLFDGPPKKEKVMRTFFQLDVHYMESSLSKDRMDELLNGIRISDLDDYNSVISTFSDYAKDKSEKVMKTTY